MFDGSFKMMTWRPVMICAALGFALGFLTCCSYNLGAAGRAKARQEAEQAKAIQKAVEQARRDERRAIDATNRVNQNAVRAETQIRWKTREVIRNVPQIITPEVNRAYPLPNGFIRLHNAAAEGLPGISPAPGGSDGEPSKIGIDQAAPTIILNYETCHLAMAQNQVWREWYQEQSKIWGAK